MPSDLGQTFKMKSMKNLSMNKMLGSIKRRTTGPGQGTTDIANTMTVVAPQSGSPPEKIARDGVKAFCESGGHVKGDEVLFLPPIVDAAESSPLAAAECARVIRKYMAKEYYVRPSWQYNAIMLLRILTQNPGVTFTRNLDQKFAETAKALLRGGKDPNVRQMMMETLDEFEHTRSYDENLNVLIQMWQKEKEKIMRDYGGAPFVRPRPNMPLFPVTGGHGPNGPNQQNYFSRSHNNNRLPDTVELASRLEEARTSAKLLEQVVMNTPPGETLDSDLIKEFADRCLSASRSIQGYMVSTDPAPDNDTMESLIDTNEQLQTALNQHQRAVLSARKQLGQNVSREDTPVSSPPPTDSAEVSRLVAGSSRNPGNGKGKQAQIYRAQASGSGSGSGSASGSGAASASGAGAAQEDPFADPFADPQPEKSNGVGSSALGEFDSDRHFSEPFHPGFTAADTNVVGGSTNAAGGSSTRQAADVAIDDDLYESTAGRKKEFAP